jgi:hypothetical protein
LLVDNLHNKYYFNNTKKSNNNNNNNKDSKSNLFSSKEKSRNSNHHQFMNKNINSTVEELSFNNFLTVNKYLKFQFLFYLLNRKIKLQAISIIK